MLLVVNTGSSSVKLALIRRGCLVAAENLAASDSPRSGLHSFLSKHQAEPRAVAHRVVHGGRQRAHATIDNSVLSKLREATPLAPLHSPIALAWIEASQELLPPPIPHVAVLDSGFFADLPRVASVYALPAELTERLALWRYGFHGLAHASMARRWSELAKSGSGSKVVTLQLGSGCSATASVDGRPIDTSMGFSPSEGLVMGTRAGDVDPGLLIHLLREHGYDASRLDALLTHESGLLGVSGRTSDMREVLARAYHGDGRAALAVDLFCYRASKVIGAYAVAMAGLDGVVFGGGIGEASAEIRRRILTPLAWLGLELDTPANESSTLDAEITRPDGRIRSFAVKVNEALEMYRITTTVLEEDPS